MSRGLDARVESNKSLAHDYTRREGKKGSCRRLLSAQFNYLARGIPPCTAPPDGEPTPAAHPLTCTHSIRLPNRAGVPQTRPAAETMRSMQVFESVKSHSREQNRARASLEMPEAAWGWLARGEDAATEWLFLKDPLLPDEPKSPSSSPLLCPTTLVETEDNQH